MTIEQKEAAYALGAQRGRQARERRELSPQWRESAVAWAHAAYPQSKHIDVESEVIRLDAERLANVPDSFRFPETRSLPDLMRSEREGFLFGAGCGEREMAFYYSYIYFTTRRLNTRYAGLSPEYSRAHHCTAVYIRDSREGGALYGRNLDDLRRPAELEEPTLQPPAAPDPSRPGLLAGSSPAFSPTVFAEKYGRWLLSSQVSSSVLGDEEPQEIFPVDVWQIMPGDCRTVKDYIEFLSRYNEFWGPWNGIFVDEFGDSVAYEKSNCRLAVHQAQEGVSAVTACAYRDAELNEFKTQAGLKVLPPDAPDWDYWRGCERRYERLLTLAGGANTRGATLEDMAAIVTDRAVPFPERICLAGEKLREEEQNANWTLTAAASVITGPRCRTLFWRVENDDACYDNPPYLIPGEGVPVEPQWRENTRSSFPPIEMAGH